MTSPDQPTERPRRRRLLVIGLGLGLLVAVGALAVWIRDATRDRTLRQLAVGTWSCAPDGADQGGLPMEITVRGKGTFSVTFPTDARPTELSGTWDVTDGDLEAHLGMASLDERFLVEGFDALTPDSRSFDLLVDMKVPAGAEDPPAPDRPKILTEAHGTDSVTFRAAGGQPWTCDRK